MLQQILEQFWRKASGHRLQQTEGEMLAAIRELSLAFAGEMPEVARPAGPLGGWTGLHQPVLFQAAQMAAHHLDRHSKRVSQFGCGGFALTQKQGQGCRAGGSLSARSRWG